MISFLIEQGASVNHTDKFDSSALSEGKPLGWIIFLNCVVLSGTERTRERGCFVAGTRCDSGVFFLLNIFIFILFLSMDEALEQGISLLIQIPSQITIQWFIRVIPSLRVNWMDWSSFFISFSVLIIFPH